MFFLKSITPPAQNILDRNRRLGRPAATRRHRVLEITDGTIYKTRPGSRLFFPAWDTTTAALPRLSPVVQEPNRAVMVPRRRRTRATERTRRILEERALNDTYVAERNRPPPF